ncbi:11508_t:CDS:2, partial [Funneliformis mosseae]
MPKYRTITWKTSVDKENATFFLLRIGQKTKTCLNNRNFFVTIIIGNKNNTSLPGYLCQSDAYISQIKNDPSRAISSVYAQMFENRTRFSGPLVLGWQDEDIIHQLLRDVLFIPILIFVDSLKIFVYRIGISSQVNWLNASPRYKSSFTHKFN